MSQSREPKPIGRPRNENVDKKVLATMAELMKSVPVRKISIELISKKSGVSKPAIYRRWGNKCAVAMDTFLQQVEPDLSFNGKAPLAEAVAQHIQQMAELMKGPVGRHVAEIVGEGQSDSHLLEEFGNRFLDPLHAPVRQALKGAMAGGELPKNFDIDLMLDMFYGPIYHRLLVAHQPIDDSFVEGLCGMAQGLLTPR